MYDLCAVVGSALIALQLRFDYFRWEILTVHMTSTPVVLCTYLLVFSAFRLYRYRWPFAGVEVFWSVLLANVIATGLGGIWQLYLDSERLPFSILVMMCILSTALIGGQRVLLRTIERWRGRGCHDHTTTRWHEEPKRTVILGGERSASEVLTALGNERSGRYDVIGILDPDTRHHGTYLRGIKILGDWELLHDLVRRHAIDEVIIAMQNGASAQLREYVLACCRHKVAVRTVPVTTEWLQNPSASRRHLRAETICPDDLLHRQPIKISQQDFDAYIGGKRILVTGAGGSIGSELCRQISRHNPALLILLGHGENSIHQINMELQHAYPELAACTVAVIADVRDVKRIDYVINQFKPQVIFHAAAHKHVPLMEGNIAEAINNNIAGSRNVIRAASAHQVERFVLISTDKAVNPSSVMGATKFLCEELVRAESARSDTCFLTVRFGNVLGSRGSVLPAFQEQILHGGPVRVTHPEMRRYFMTIPEAVSLVLCAGSIGCTGQLFVLDMGQPVRIVRLAEDLIRLSGLVPYRDIEIAYCGLRPGEKLTEELFTESEQRQTCTQERLLVVNRPQYIDAGILDQVIDELLVIAQQHDDRALYEQLTEIIPTFQAGNMEATPPLKAA